jgi:hypothetical protein
LANNKSLPQIAQRGADKKQEPGERFESGNRSGPGYRNAMNFMIGCSKDDSCIFASIRGQLPDLRLSAKSAAKRFLAISCYKEFR